MGWKREARDRWALRVRRLVLVHNSRVVWASSAADPGGLEFCVKRHQVTWTAEMEAVAREAWLRGATATQVADEISRRLGVVFTRSAILGKLSRLKLQRYADGKPAPRQVFPRTLGDSFEDKGCRYIEGDPLAGGVYCGKPCEHDVSPGGNVRFWCVEHRAMVYRPKSEERSTNEFVVSKMGKQRAAHNMILSSHRTRGAADAAGGRDGQGHNMVLGTSHMARK